MALTTRQRLRAPGTRPLATRAGHPAKSQQDRPDAQTGGSDACMARSRAAPASVPDLIPDPGRDLELQLRRGRVHLLGRADQLDQVTARGPAPPSPAPLAEARTREDSRHRGLAPALLPPARRSASRCPRLPGPLVRMSAIRLRERSGQCHARCCRRPVGRRRSVSSIARCMDGVTESAYMCTWPTRSARPGRWSGSVRCPTAGSPPCRRQDGHQRHLRQVSPSRSRLIPTSTSYSPTRSSRSSTRRSVHLAVQVARPDAGFSR